MADETRLKQALGKWVTGDEFWNRQHEIASFVEKIDNGDHLLLVAQRRMGKTSLMREVARRMGDRDTCLFVDLQKCATGSEAVVELSLAMHPFKSLWVKTKHVFKNVLERLADGVEEISLGDIGVRMRAGLTSGDWMAKGDELFRILSTSEKPVLLLLDEVPLLVNRILKGEDFTITPQRRTEAERFMSWLRGNSLQHQGRVRIVVSGSVGFEPILHQARLSATINNFFPFELKPWDEATAIACLEALGNEYGIRFADGAARAMVSRLGCCIPHHVQTFFSFVRDRCERRGQRTVCSEEVAEIYDSEMLGIRGHVELAHYEERLRLVLGDLLLPLALEMLTEAAKTEQKCLTPEALTAIQSDYEFPDRTVQEAQKDILHVLEHDGYLKRAAGGYVFVSYLLRDWWEARHGGFHTPIMERGG